MRWASSMACAALIMAGPASAQGFDWDDVSLSASFVSDLRFRGISQSARHAAPELEIDWNAGDGWSLGAFASQVDFKDGEGTSVETDFYGAKDFDLNGTTLSLQAYYYAYPNHHPPRAGRRYSAVEGMVSARRTVGDWNFNASLAASPDYSDESGPSAYASVGVSYDITSRLTASANVGELWVKSWDRLPVSGYPYTHWDIGTTFTWEKLSLDVRLVGTSLSSAECLVAEGGGTWCDTALVVSVSYGFDTSVLSKLFR